MALTDFHAELDEVVLLYEEGVTGTELAERYGISHHTVTKHLRRRGVKIRAPGQNLLGSARRAIPVTHYSEVAERYRNGENTEELGRAYGVTRSTIRKILVRVDEPRRGVGHRKRLQRCVNYQGYVTLTLPPDDPLTSMRKKNGQVLEHRLVMARHLGRPLHPKESVHHKNGDRADNRLENLQLRHRWHGYGQALCCSDCGSRNIVPAELKSNPSSPD